MPESARERDVAISPNICKMNSELSIALEEVALRPGWCNGKITNNSTVFGPHDPRKGFLVSLAAGSSANVTARNATWSSDRKLINFNYGPVVDTQWFVRGLLFWHMERAILPHARCSQFWGAAIMSDRRFGEENSLLTRDCCGLIFVWNLKMANFPKKGGTMIWRIFFRAGRKLSPLKIEGFLKGEAVTAGLEVCHLVWRAISSSCLTFSVKWPILHFIQNIGMIWWNFA